MFHQRKRQPPLVVSNPKAHLGGQLTLLALTHDFATPAADLGMIHQAPTRWCRAQLTNELGLCALAFATNSFKLVMIHRCAVFGGDTCGWRASHWRHCALGGVTPWASLLRHVSHAAADFEYKMQAREALVTPSSHQAVLRLLLLIPSSSLDLAIDS